MTACLLMMSISRAQQPQSIQPAFHVQTDLVVIPFQVRRGSGAVSELKPSDVVLLEDGTPRGFTGFEAPHDHPSLELVVMFDTTSVRWKDGFNLTGGFWTDKMLHDLVDYWNDAIARAFLEEPVATVRISVYQLEQSRLRRLCRSTSNPRELLDALNHLVDPIPTGAGFDLSLPKGVLARPDDQEEERRGGIPWPRSLLGSMTALRESMPLPPVCRFILQYFLQINPFGMTATPFPRAQRYAVGRVTASAAVVLRNGVFAPTAKKETRQSQDVHSVIAVTY
jgi:hypothetical protein